MSSLDSALRRADGLQDEKLYAALQLAEGDRRWAALLDPPNYPIRNSADDGNQRHVMCPDLYRAAVSGSFNRVNELLGRTEEIANSFEVSSDSIDARVHGEGLCTLQEVTAEKNNVLHIAAEQGHVELIEQIVQRDNTLLVSENSRHETPLQLAARAGHRHIVSLIIFKAQESGIGAFEVLMRKNTEGDTVLHEAARHGHEDILQVLMTVAPALSAEVNNASMSPLYIAAVRKFTGAVKALLLYSHTSAVGPNQKNALHAAVLGSRQITSLLLNWKSDLANERDASGSTPLHYAVSSGDFTAVKSILEKAPSSAYIQDQEGSSPLHVAARMLNYSVISCIIKYCPDSFELRDNRGWNFLHIVVQLGGSEINLSHEALKPIISTINLVSASPDMKKLVNERDNRGNTPLHLASINGLSEIILHLLQNTEADTTLMNNEGKTALDHAVLTNTFFQMARSTVTLSAYGAIFSPQRQDKLNNWTDKTTKSIDRVSKNLIIVSVLIATIAYSAAFNVPGSYNSDGAANLHRNVRYHFFVILDSTATSASTSAAILLVVAKTVTKRTSWAIFCVALILSWVSLFTMEIAFLMAVSVSMSNGGRITKIIIYDISFCLFFSTAISIHKIGSPGEFRTVRKFLSSLKEQTQTTRQIEIQFPMLRFYVRSSNFLVFLSSFFYLIASIILWIFLMFDYYSKSKEK